MKKNGPLAVLIHFSNSQVFVCFSSDGDGNLFLSDFGISRKLLSGTTLFTKAMGSLCWMCPDSLEGDISKCKKSSDIQVKYMQRRIGLSVT